MDKTYIFLHNPKCAGETLKEYLKSAFKNTYEIDPNNTLGSIHQYLKLPDDEKVKYDLISGHCPFGLHDYQPKDFRYILFLRNPIDRVISHYFYVLNTPRHYLHNAAQKFDIYEFILRNFSIEVDNAQTRMLNTFNPNEKQCWLGNYKVNKKHYQKALATYECFRDKFFIGFSDSKQLFNESLDKLQQFLPDYAVLPDRREVVNNKGNYKSNVKNDEKLINLITEKNQFDLKLYNYFNILREQNVLYNFS